VSTTHKVEEVDNTGMPNEPNEEEDLAGDEAPEITSMVDEEGEHLAMH